MLVPRAVLVLVTTVHLVAQLVAPDGTVAEVTQPLLMPVTTSGSW